MRVSDNGLDLIKSFEGLRLRAYLCPAGKWTIGYGTTGPHVVRGLIITKAKAEEFLEDSLADFGIGVLSAVKPAKPNQAEFDAMVSLAYNIGLGNFRKSSVVRQFKVGNKAEAAEAFMMWSKAKNPRTGRKESLPGLVRRRAAEKQLFLSGAQNRTVTRKVSLTRVAQLPESSVVPEAPKPLTRSREIIGGSVVGTGGVLQIINGITTDDAKEIKKGVAEIKTDVNGSVLEKMHLPEIASGLTVALSLFIIWKRFSDRKNGIR